MLILNDSAVVKRNNSNVTSASITNQIDGEVGSSHGYHIPMEVVVGLMLLLFLINLIGNFIVVLIIAKKRRMQTFTNWLLLNLAIADLSVALICIPLEIPIEIKGYWIYGRIFCKIFYPIQTASIYGSVFTLVALSFSRYWAIIHPFRSQPNVTHAKIMIGVIWVCSVVFVVPYISVLEYKDGSCGETWTASQKRIYTVAIFVFQFVLPMSVIAIAYCCIMYEFSFRKKYPSKSVSTTSAVSAAVPPVPNKVRCKQQSENRKVVKLLLIITVTFAVCLLPFHTLGLVGEFYSSTFAYYNDIFLASYLLLYINSCLNPIIYNVFNERFRETFKELYKTLIAYFCLRHAENEREDFFSSRRPSKLSFHSLYEGHSSRLSCKVSLRNPGNSFSEGTMTAINESSTSFLDNTRSPFLSPASAAYTTNSMYNTNGKYNNGIKKLSDNNNIHSNSGDHRTMTSDNGDDDKNLVDDARGDEFREPFLDKKNSFD